MMMYAPNADMAWRQQLATIRLHGDPRTPRGKPTRDMQNACVVVDMREPVVTCPERKLSYRFMAAEAYWILSGDDTVAGIAPWNDHIREFSDDGHRFFGAYGPKVAAQLPYVVQKLRNDIDTRQAGLTIWRESPPDTKDVPCTVAMWFGISDHCLECFVFMRSSDVWLGLPYDIFNFSMIAHRVCEIFNQGSRYDDGPDAYELEPGFLHLTMVSSHLYEKNGEAATAIIDASAMIIKQPKTSPLLFDGHRGDRLMQVLADLRDSKPGHPLRWWERGV